MGWLRPYIDVMYLNHGYAFFAPNPGSSYLLRARLEYADGRSPVELTLPDRQRHWPRLLYHRHFMLSEHLNAAFAPAEPPPEIGSDRQQVEDWRFVRSMYEARRAAIERYLLTRDEADQVTLEQIEHRLLDPAEVISSRRLDDPETYLVLPETGDARGGP